MKKILLIWIAVLGLLFVSACKEAEPDVKEYTKSFINTYMDTYIRVDYATDDKELANQIAIDIEDILARYHDLTNNYDPPRDQAYSPNIYNINQHIGEKLEIHQDLYDILVLSEEIKIMTDGYFDIGVGKLVDLWKAQIADQDGTPTYDDGIIPDQDFTDTVNLAEAMDFSDSVIILTEESGLYYIETAGANLKLDLGAISKGYATQMLHTYLSQQGLTYFLINSGTSSFVFGQNMNRETGLYHIGLEDPTANGSAYGVVYVKDTSLTTSGNFIQYALHNDLRYHHIVSPITTLPMQYYHTLSLIADDAGVLDALSTALFSMDPDTLNAWLAEHQADLGLEVISYNYDGTITTHMLDTVFEEA